MTKFNPNSLFYADGYKVGHYRMLAPNTAYLYGTWIPRGLKYAPANVTKIVSFGARLTVKWLHDEFTNNFFGLPKEEAMKFGEDMSNYLGMKYDFQHFSELYDLGYLPLRIKALPEGIETDPNIPHMTFINTVKGFAWLPLYLETAISSASWKSSTSATIALRYRRNVEEWVLKTDPANSGLIPFMCHDFSARGLSPWDMLTSGLGHATSFRGSDTLVVIPGARYYYNEPEDEVCINSVNASEHSVSTTKIFTVGESQMITDWMKLFPDGIFSLVSDTFNLWDVVTKYLPENKQLIMSRNGKLVIRPDSGDPVDIICGEIYDRNLSDYPTEEEIKLVNEFEKLHYESPQGKGVVELLWEIFGGTVNEQGYKVLDPHIGVIYGDAITLERQLEIYSRLARKGFAATNVVLGVGSYTYQRNTRDALGFAAKGSWFQIIEEDGMVKDFDIYKDPITDDGTKRSLRGRLCVIDEHTVLQHCTEESEKEGLLQVIYEDGKLLNTMTFTEIRNNINKLI